METKIFENKTSDIKEAAELIRQGKTVVFPTETVYGLGANALDSDAVKKIFIAKGRPSDNPLIVHIPDFDAAAELTLEIPQKAKALAQRFCPGPLTMIFKKKDCIPDEVSAGLDTVGIRIPEDEVARAFLSECKVPVAAPSANISGRPSPTTFQHVVEDMDGRVDGIIHGDRAFVGVESTVVDMTSEIPVVLRPGGISVEEIAEVVGEVLVSSELKADSVPKAPGMKYKHYSPKGQTFILKGDIAEISEFLERRSKVRETAVLVFDEFMEYMPAGVKTLSLGSNKNPKDAAQRLFDCLRECDALGVCEIYAPEIPDEGLWRAVKNRLYKAASARIVDVKSSKTILFVCTGNTCRSPMAEGIFNSLGKNGVAASAGIMASGGGAEENAVLAASFLGADIKNHIPRQITLDMIENSDVVLTMTRGHKFSLPEMEGIYTISEFVNESQDINDPFGGDLETYKECAAKLKEIIEKMEL